MNNIQRTNQEPEDNQYLYKHVATIHKSNTLSLLQNKISNILYFNAYATLKIDNVHIITIKELCELLNYRGHNYEEIKIALRGLISTVIEWNLLKDEKLGDENWTASTALASASIKKGGICEYSYSYHMRELLADPAMYGVINMTYQANFRSKYGLALYENCARFINIKQTGWFDIEFFRALMGVEKNKYLQFRDFKRRVLDVAVDEINMYSDIYVEAIVQRVGKRVAKLKFKLEKREKKPKINLTSVTQQNFSLPAVAGEGNEYSSGQLEIASQLKREFLLSSKQVDWCINHYEMSYIKEKIALIQQTAKNVRSLSAYFISALKSDYQANKPLEEIKRQEITQSLNEFEQIKCERLIEKLNTDYHLDLKIPDFLKRFDNYLLANYSHLYKQYSQTRFSTNEVRWKCYQFYIEKFSGLLEDE